MSYQIRSINDLQDEIFRLKTLESHQSAALKARVSSPSAIFSSVMSLFPRSVDSDGVRSPGLFHPDIINLVSRFVIPLTLNKTLFRNSNFLVKTLVGLVSQKASNYVNEDSVSGIWGTVKGLFEKFTKKKSKDEYKPEPYKKPVAGPVV
ncbi:MULTISPECIES: hypothetical protein [unclassified Mucilaginibacter]|jgi:hypothetical protein|uniref:hypothetical protein n=1 Tax=unclassified Mucilaginibacter TaxID=2617802 RepID=UPI0008AD0BE5|nr:MULTISPECIES: hypothetical protein [unclassified Mucilaginibacter]WDF79288.1 hypothetical protein PQ469_04640 [Mucilaginibacter sp. KACC 22773]SEO49827.1 hypothetical protein SAMN05428947_102579 [Mucilaginibacter sp. OK283]